MNKILDKRLSHTIVGGMPVALVSDAELTSAMLDDVEQRRAGLNHRALTVFDSNAQGISLYAEDAQFAKAIDAADIIHADGQIVVWASKWTQGSKGIPERTATTDFIHSAAAAAAKNDVGFYLLGSTEEINRGCAEELAALYPGLKIVGRRNGYFDASDEEAVIADINASKADILWVGLGKPKEQLFANRIASKLDHCAWIVTCGGCFHFVVGDYPRAPLWMQKMGLEWLHRMATGPRYLFRRHMRTLPHALSIVLRKDVPKRFERR
ncbi:WecB/TagA/CpsF family glycosyltransferase [Ruegeria sp. THAF57]|uniref:WecB/TagA/CpsF family glycosyltransferase n=1 Tax=Ruegeria sp. THAF57 TaxID=2744555 RepID=UPI0015DEEE48|nr:WecB/TagA/CpsF family glycosyltransferase [Ruegeria sp. THAF57]